MKPFTKPNRHSIDSLFVLLIFFGFVMMAILLIALSSNIYRKTVSDADANNERRMVIAYLTQKVRQNKNAENIEVVTLKDTEALAFPEEIDGESYTTYLYVYKDQLRELFTETGNDQVSLSSGAALMPISSISFEEQKGRAIAITAIGQTGTPISFLIHLQ